MGITAIVHLLNNLFKLVLLGKHAKRPIVLKFGIPAILSAFLGAYILIWFADMQPVTSYILSGKLYQIQPIKLVIGILIMFFAFIELMPGLNSTTFGERYLSLGGVLSGFFGGLSGHQGALRSAFLIRCGLTKESFIATGVVIGCIVDIGRLTVYSSRFTKVLNSENLLIIGVAVLAAFTGAYSGSKLIKKVTLRSVQLFVSLILFLISAGLISGMI